MLAAIVATNNNTAQLMFLIAVIVCAVVIVVSIIERGFPFLAALWAIVLLFVSLGLLFST